MANTGKINERLEAPYATFSDLADFKEFVGHLTSELQRDPAVMDMDEFMSNPDGNQTQTDPLAGPRPR